MLAALLQDRPRPAREGNVVHSDWCAAAAGLTICGAIHSPFPDGRLFLPWAIGGLPAEAAGRGPLEMASAYALLAAVFLLWRPFAPAPRPPAEQPAQLPLA